MARIKIKDLPEDSRISDAEAKKAFGGAMGAAMSLQTGPMMRSGGPLQTSPGAGSVQLQTAKPGQVMNQAVIPGGGGRVPGQAAMPNCTDTCW